MDARVVLDPMNSQFGEALRRLASAADEQEAFLRRLGTAPSADELAIEFSDVLQVVEEDLSAAVRRSALQLDRYLVDISGRENERLWTIDALRRAREWVHIRKLASQVLGLIDAGDG